MKKKNFTLSVGLFIGLFVFAGIGKVQGSSIVIEAKDFENKSAAIVDEGTHISGIVPWEWVSFNAITIATAGDYLIEYEVASVGGGGVFQLEQGGVGTVFGTATIPETGAADVWQVASHVVTLPAGEVAFGVKGIGDNWNAWGLKSITISEAGAIEAPEYITIEAENFTGKDGDVVNEGTYLSNIAPWRWISFDNISIPETGTYLVEYRVACAGGGDYLNLEQGGTSNVHGSIDIPDTGGNDQWEIISHTVELTAGIQNFGIKGMGDAWNSWSLDWFRFSLADGTVSSSNGAKLGVSGVAVYPVPASSGELKMDISLESASDIRLSVFDISGAEVAVVFAGHLSAGNYSFGLVGNLNTGVYFLRLHTGGDQKVARFVIK